MQDSCVSDRRIGPGWCCAGLVGARTGEDAGNCHFLWSHCSDRRRSDARARAASSNDMFDRDFDAQVARTADRPLAPVPFVLRARCVFLAALLLVSRVILVQFNPFAWRLARSVWALVIPYRDETVTWWPQAWLGPDLQLGAVLGWPWCVAKIEPATLVLYAAAFLTLGYDTNQPFRTRKTTRWSHSSHAAPAGANSRPGLPVSITVCIALLRCLHGWWLIGWPSGSAWRSGIAHLILANRRHHFDGPGKKKKKKKKWMLKNSVPSGLGLIIFAAAIAAGCIV